MDTSAEDRFWAKVAIPADVLTGCWEWTAHIARNGYGRFQLKGAPVGAHRFAYEAVKGPIPEALHLDHLCRVRHCVNPAHLEAVTCAVNIRRGTRARGEKHYAAKLTESQVREIISAPKERGVAASLARRFAVSEQAISRIRRVKHWTHIEAAP